MGIDMIKSILFGIVEGITEWLPISSTGHMILLEEFVKLSSNEDFMEMFNVVIQLGAIMAVVILYFSKLWPFQSPKKPGGIVKHDTFRLWLKVIVASIPAMAIGLPFDDVIDELFFNTQTVAATLVIYGIAFIWLEKRKKPRHLKLIREEQELSLKTAFLIGCFQALSMIPGTSRSGATILGASLLGVARPMAAEFSFFMGIPAMAGASLIKVLKFIMGGFALTQSEVVILAVGTVTAFVVSVLAIRTFISYIQKHSFVVFGWYRIALGALVAAYFLFVK